ncbi:MAG: polyprenyl synthetase family protein [Anaerolineales bacterium]
MSLLELQGRFIPQIEDSLQVKINTFDFKESSPLKRMLTYQMGWTIDGAKDGGGKRIRPFLTLLCAGAFKNNIEAAIPAAIAIEFLHNFTLIHDDIQDQSPLRHGKPTLWKKWGLAQAINAGDALFSISQLALLDLAATTNDHICYLAAQELNQVCLKLTQGQYLDIAFESLDNVEINTYFDMIEGKTAALISFSTFAGGLVTDQTSEVLDLLSTFGQSVGMAFQIQDDYLGIWGDPLITGKSAASDIMTRKKTLPILYGLNHCSVFLEEWQNTKMTKSHVLNMANILEDCGAKQFVQTKATGYTEKAFNTLEKLFPKKNAYSSALFELTHHLLTRNA